VDAPVCATKEVTTLRTDGKWDEVLATATELAMELDIDTVVQEKREKKFIEELTTVTGIQFRVWTAV